MAHIQNVLVLAVLCVLAGALTHHSHRDHEDRDGRHRHPHDDFGDWHSEQHSWVTCDFSIEPKMRCHDCNARLICKRIGGLRFNCTSPLAPYCNNGLCSPVPSAECAKF